MLRHKNIVELYHAFVDGKDVVLIMEYAGGGTLLDYVTSNYPLGEITARKIFLQIANAIHYCHLRGVVHRDLKLENVLFKDSLQEQIKIIDFGIAGVCVKG
jgi:serine/threonine protein kinase